MFYFHDSEDYIESYKVCQFQGPHRVVRSEFHYSVDIFLRGDPFGVYDYGLVNHGSKYSVGDESRCVLDHDSGLSDLICKCACTLDSLI